MLKVNEKTLVSKNELNSAFITLVLKIKNDEQWVRGGKKKKKKKDGTKTNIWSYY